ncbi:hypothetical protein G6F43_010727 [Rhizopus delemar]|nr:hypothetical protein G6F43_010727 [Rhizopus delemar]
MCQEGSKFVFIDPSITDLNHLSYITRAQEERNFRELLPIVATVLVANEQVVLSKQDQKEQEEDCPSFSSWLVSDEEK